MLIFARERLTDRQGLERLGGKWIRPLSVRIPALRCLPDRGRLAPAVTVRANPLSAENAQAVSFPETDEIFIMMIFIWGRPCVRARAGVSACASGAQCSS